MQRLLEWTEGGWVATAQGTACSCGAQTRCRVQTVMLREYLDPCRRSRPPSEDGQPIQRGPSLFDNFNSNKFTFDTRVQG